MFVTRQFCDICQQVTFEGCTCAADRLRDYRECVRIVAAMPMAGPNQIRLLAEALGVVLETLADLKDPQR